MMVCPMAGRRNYGLDPNQAADSSSDQDGDGYNNIEEYLNGTDPTVFADYTKPENDVNSLAKSHRK